jgi:uncharacterized protein
MSERIPGAVVTELGAYVYLLVDPRDEKIFYVGKGRGQRCLDHLSMSDDGIKTQHIRELRKNKLEPRVDILIHGLDDDMAHKVETSVIDVLEWASLKNLIGGKGSRQHGRIPLVDLVARLENKPVVVTDPVLLIRINENFCYDMTPAALYDATRGVWKLGSNREKVKFVMPVFEGIVREVYEVMAWFPGGTTFYPTRNSDEVNAPDRWEFVGNLASEVVRRKYRNRSVVDYFAANAQNPVTYVLPAKH